MFGLSGNRPPSPTDNGGEALVPNFTIVREPVATDGSYVSAHEQHLQALQERHPFARVVDMGSSSAGLNMNLSDGERTRVLAGILPVAAELYAGYALLDVDVPPSPTPETPAA